MHTCLFDANRRGKKDLKSSRDKNPGREPYVVGRGKEPAICDPGSELRLGGREKRRGEIINVLEKRKRKKNIAVLTHFRFSICDRKTSRSQHQDPRSQRSYEIHTAENSRTVVLRT